MKKIISILVLTFSIVSSAIAAPAVLTNLSKQGFNRYSRQKPVIIFLSIGCNIGDHYNKQFIKNFKTMQGVYLSVVDYNNKYSIFYTPLKMEVGSILIAWKGKVVASSVHDDEFLFGYNQQYMWAIKHLKKMGARIQYQPLDNARIAPVKRNYPVNIEKGKTSQFFFNGNLQDAIGKGFFKLNNKSRLHSGKLYINGSSSGNITFTHARFPKIGNTTTPFTMSFNFIQKKGGFLNQNVLFEIGNRFITVFINKGKLIFKISASGRPAGCQKYDHYREYYTFYETNISYNTYHNIILVWKPQQQRLSVMIDGKRLKDLKFSTKLKIFFSRFSIPISKVLFGRNGSSHGFRGAIDDLVIFNRALNHGEMKALYRLFGLK